MNLDDDYDNDGNNIVPCPICLDVYCPSKENGKCPEEDMFALEGEIRMLLDEYKATDDNSRIANVLEAVEKILHHQLQKARQDWLQKAREEQNTVLLAYQMSLEAGNVADVLTDIKNRIKVYHSELDQDVSK